jgi:hypothetical protein
MNTPIIFLHYEESEYMPYTLGSAIKLNNNVILIGDIKNKKYESIGVKHFFIDDYIINDDVEKLNKVYRRIGGEEFELINSKKGGTDWTKFNFQKWFVLYAFCKANDIQKFWTFDTDNMILRDLSLQETKFDGFDCTEQNMEMSMQGLINNIEVLKDFLDTIIDLFGDEDYLDEQRRDFEEHPNYGFTMMRAYKAFRKRNSGFRSCALREVRDNEIFLDFLFYSQGMEVKENVFLNREIKQLYISSKKYFYVKDANKDEYYRVNSIDLSWLPIYYYEFIYRKISDHSYNSEEIEESKDLQKVYFHKPFIFFLRQQFYFFRRKLGLAK